MKTLFEQLGNIATIKALVNEFYDVMERDPFAKELRSIHPEKLISTRKNLFRFLTHWFGGPEIFNSKYTNSEWLELRHSRIELNDKLNKQWIYCMETALKNLDIKSDVSQNVLVSLKEMIDKMIVVRNSK